MSRPRLILPAVALASAAALVAVTTLQMPGSDADAPEPSAHPAASHGPHDGTHTGAGSAEAACDLNVSACTVTLANGRSGQLEILPRPIPAAQPLQVIWRESSSPAGSGNPGGPAEALPATVDLQFEGIDMDMGFNRARLTRQADDSYAGNAMLPVCTTGSMRWRARIERGAQRDAASIEFIAPQQR